MPQPSIGAGEIRREVERRLLGAILGTSTVVQAVRPTAASAAKVVVQVMEVSCSGLKAEQRGDRSGLEQARQPRVDEGERGQAA